MPEPAPVTNATRPEYLVVAGTARHGSATGCRTTET
jgi:hypothetical protein